jgi:hypothetical protein
MVRRFLTRLGGKTGQSHVNAVVSSFATMAQRLDTAHGKISDEIRANAAHQMELEARNIDLRADRERAVKVRSKLAEFIA